MLNLSRYVSLESFDPRVIIQVSTPSSAEIVSGFGLRTYKNAYRTHMRR